MVFGGALVHVDFVRAVVGFFGQPAATEAALAAVCAFASAAETDVLELPEVTVTLLNLALCCVAAAASTFLFSAVSGTGVLVVVLVVELEALLVESPVTSTAEPRRHAIEVRRTTGQSCNSCRAEGLWRTQTRLHLVGRSNSLQKCSGVRRRFAVQHLGNQAQSSGVAREILLGAIRASGHAGVRGDEWSIDDLREACRLCGRFRNEHAGRRL